MRANPTSFVERTAAVALVLLSVCVPAAVRGGDAPAIRPVLRLEIEPDPAPPGRLGFEPDEVTVALQTPGRASPRGADEQALFDLGASLYERGNSRTGRFRLEEALRRYPDSPRALLGRYQLAECYRQLAAEAYGDSSNSGGRSTADRAAAQEFMEKAIAIHESLVRTLPRSRTEGASSADRAALLRKATSALLDCRSELVRYTGTSRPASRSRIGPSKPSDSPR